MSLVWELTPILLGRIPVITCVPQVLENRSIEDEKRMAQLEDQLKEARNQAEEADKKYDEVAKRLAQCETDLDRAEERAETGETKGSRQKTFCTPLPPGFV